MSAQKLQYVRLIDVLIPYALASLNYDRLPLGYPRGNMCASMIPCPGGEQIGWWAKGSKAIYLLADGQLVHKEFGAPTTLHTPSINMKYDHLKGLVRMLHVLASAPYAPSEPNCEHCRPSPPREVGKAVLIPPYVRKLPAGYPTQEIRTLLYDLPKLKERELKGWWKTFTE